MAQRLAIGGGFVAVFALAQSLACGTPNVGLSLSLARSVAGQAKWYEVGAYRTGSCALVTPMLSGGVPEGATARLAFQPDDADPPSFGRIPNDRYAFAAVARNATCGVIAQGCTELDVGGTSQVVIALDATDQATGACSAGTVCQAGKCVPPVANGDPSVGAACSLELLGAGPLATSLSGTGTIVSAPAIAAIANGFVIGYREVSPTSAGARITLLTLDASGGAAAPLQPTLPNPCSDLLEFDGVGLVAGTDGKGLLALSKAACSDTDPPELQLLNFTQQGTGAFIVSKNQNASRSVLGSARAAASRPDGNVVVFAGGGTGNIALRDPAKGIVPPNGTFGAQGVTSAWVAASESALALLAAGTGATPTTGDAGMDTTPESDATLRLSILPVNTAIDAIVNPTPIVFPGVWASVAATAGRVIVFSDSSGGRSVNYRAFDQGGSTTPSDFNGFSVEGESKVTSGDIAIVNNRAYFATLKSGAISLDVYANATTVLTPLRSVFFGRETRISAVNLVRDGKVAVAATDSRVAVVWTTAQSLLSNDVTGGYAVFACAQ